MASRWTLALMRMAYFAIIIWRLNYYIDPLTNIVLTLAIGMLFKVANYGSSIILDETKRIVKDYHRVGLESLGLFIDGHFEVNYCFQIIIFERFVDIYIFVVRYWPLIRQYGPSLVPIVTGMLHKSFQAKFGHRQKSSPIVTSEGEKPIEQVLRQREKFDL